MKPASARRDMINLSIIISRPGNAILNASNAASSRSISPNDAEKTAPFNVSVEITGSEYLRAKAKQRQRWERKSFR